MDEAVLKTSVQEHLDKLIPIFAKASIGDFSHNIEIPQQEDEFTGLYVGVQIMLDVIREKIHTLEDLNLELQERVTEQNAFLQGIGEGVTILDPDGSVRFLNHAAETLLGWSETEMKGKSWVDMVPLETADRTRVETEKRPMETVEKGSTIPSPTYYYVCKNGGRFPVSTTISLVDIGDGKVGKAIVFRDVSKEKVIEQLKNDFLMLATHQLRSPLTNIRWLMESILTSDISGPVRDKLQDAYQNNLHLIALVNDILSVSRIDQGAVNEQKGEYMLSSIVDDAVKQVRPWLEKSTMEIVIGYDPVSIQEAKYIVDGSLLSHCLQNLLFNGVKYGDLGTTIRMKIKSDEHTNVCFEITNQGIGIPEIDKPHIFEKFYRGHNIDTLNSPGTGLGLYVVSSVVRLWGGTISFVSEEHKETTVTICIPLEKVS